MLPDTDDHPVQLVFGYYDDWFRPAALQQVIDDFSCYADWEWEAIIAAEAVYAENFLSPN